TVQSSFRFHENGTAVPHPPAVGRINDKLHIFQIGSGTREISPRLALLGFILHENADAFAGRNFSYHLTINPADRVELVRPVGWVIRPAQPGGFVFLPLSRHRKAQSGRCVPNLIGSHDHKGGKDRGFSSLVDRRRSWRTPLARWKLGSCDGKLRAHPVPV